MNFPTIEGHTHIPVGEVTAEDWTGWLREALIQTPGPRGSGAANMWGHYTAYIKERILANRAQKAYELSEDFVPDARPVGRHVNPNLGIPGSNEVPPLVSVVE